MPTGLRERLTSDEVECLRKAMEWVIPSDESPGAGTYACMNHLFELIDAFGEPATALYKENLRNLNEADLADPNHPLATTFINHVRDVYYGYPDTGAWEDIGFEVIG